LAALSDPALAPLVDALAPRAEQGGAVLAVGGALATRRAWGTRVLAQLAEAPTPPLLVRVPPRTAERHRGPSLAEELAAAAEAALVGAGAPGGLYDDAGGGALAALGGWLFRARSVRRAGLVLLLEEIDDWLDGRGGGGPDAATLALLEQLLAECSRRALSLLVTVRAADAAGLAALPAALANRFDRCERLGGAPTVTRDPSGLVAALAGRSFSLGALKHALAGWLEVPGSDDDTVVVFTSPLAPPVLPAAPPEGAALEWARTPRPPSDPPVANAGPRAGAPSAALSTPGPQTLRAAVEVREALRVLEALPRAPGTLQLERAYAAGASRLPLALAAFGEGAQALGLGATRLRGRAEAALQRFEVLFAEHYPRAWEAWQAGAHRPTLLCDLPARLATRASERGARGTALVVLTGLRLDAWRRLRGRVLPRVPGLVLLEQGLHWAARPTTPATQRELLARGLSALGAAAPWEETGLPRTLAEALRPRREHLGHTEVLRLDAYAVALQDSFRPLAEALAPVEEALPATLAALCGGLTTRTVLALAGDVGLHAARDRYVFGADSPFAALVPYALLAWG
jgi:hypothetical protein